MLLIKNSVESYGQSTNNHYVGGNISNNSRNSTTSPTGTQNVALMPLQVNNSFNENDVPHSTLPSRNKLSTAAVAEDLENLGQLAIPNSPKVATAKLAAALEKLHQVHIVILI